MRRIQLELRACKDKLAEIPQDFFDISYLNVYTSSEMDYNLKHYLTPNDFFLFLHIKKKMPEGVSIGVEKVLRQVV